MATRSALDPSIRYDDADQEGAQMRAQQRDQMMRAWMQNQQMSAQRSMQQEDMGARERMFNAELTDRGAGRQYNGGLQMNLAEMSQRPQIAQLDFNKQRYADERGDGASARELSQFKDQYLIGKLKGIQGGASGSVLSPTDEKAMIFGAMNLPAPRDVNQETQDFMRQIAKARFMADPNADFAGFAKAFQSGDFSSIPQKPQETIPLEMVGKALTDSAKSFGEKDAAMIGWDPTDEDVTGIIKKRDQYAQSVRARNPRLTPEQATEQANFLIEQEIAPNASRMGTEWILKLRQALRGQAQPAATPAADFPGADVGQWQG